MTKRGDIIILHMYGSWDMEHKSQIFFLTCTINENHMMYGSWDVECDSQNFLSFWAIFDLLPHSQPRKSKLKKNKKMPGDIVTLHMCTINDDHMMYGSWDMVHNRQIFLSFWTIFCPFTPLTTWEIMKYGAQ